jgi:signal transduction histidine kinase/FixJ family two-component response regulator
MHETPIRVLVVDDDEDDYIIARELISSIRERRYQVDWANSYKAGLEAVLRREHLICLLDYRLGELTGLDLLRQARQSGCRVPMILLTGQGDHEVDVEAMKAGAADYLVKGQLNADTLERAIRYAIEGSIAEESLRRERDLISRITETSPVGIVMACRTGSITFANHRAEEVLGLSKDAITRGACSVLEWGPTDTDGNPIPSPVSPLKQVLDSGQPVRDIRMAIQSHSRRVLLSTNAAPLLDAAGKVDGMVVTVEDITERLNLEAQLRQSQKMECVGQLAAGVAHDINNVLTVIQGHAGILLNNIPPGAPFEKSLKQISVAAERAARFIRQLLMFSRKQVFQTKVVDLNTVLHNLEGMLTRLLGEDIALETRYRGEIPRIEADTGMMEQVVMNLAVNARDAMPKGGKLTVLTSCVAVDEEYARHNSEARAGNFVCLAVADTGCGMDNRTLQRIFEPFFSTKEVGKGTGLGLATVYGIVKQHHGWIEVESEVGAGTKFKVYFPAVDMAPDSATEFITKPEPIRGGRESLLIVEDEPGLREIVQEVMKEYQYQVAVASSGAEALRIWEEAAGKFDLLLTDMRMPGGMTGLELAEGLKKKKPDLKVIYTSGYSDELTGKDLKQDNLIFLAKPYLPSQLARLVRRCLDAPLKTRAPKTLTAASNHGDR